MILDQLLRLVICPVYFRRVPVLTPIVTQRAYSIGPCSLLTGVTHFTPSFSIPFQRLHARPIQYVPGGHQRTHNMADPSRQEHGAEQVSDEIESLSLDTVRGFQC